MPGIIWQILTLGTGNGEWGMGNGLIFQILCANGALFPGALMGDVQILCANGALFWEGFCPWFRELQEHRALGLLRTFDRALR